MTTSESRPATGLRVLRGAVACRYAGEDGPGLKRRHLLRVLRRAEAR